MLGLMLLFVYLLIVFSISYFIGRKKKVGFWWSAFFCSFLTPILGLIITLKSDIKGTIEINTQFPIVGYLLLIFGCSGLYLQLSYLKTQNVFFDSSQLSLSIGMIGSGIYLIKGRIL